MSEFQSDGEGFYMGPGRVGPGYGLWIYNMI